MRRAPVFFRRICIFFVIIAAGIVTLGYLKRTSINAYLLTRARAHIEEASSGILTVGALRGNILNEVTAHNCVLWANPEKSKVFIRTQKARMRFNLISFLFSKTPLLILQLQNPDIYLQNIPRKGSLRLKAGQLIKISINDGRLIASEEIELLKNVKAKIFFRKNDLMVESVIGDSFAGGVNLGGFIEGLAQRKELFYHFEGSFANEDVGISLLLDKDYAETDTRIQASFEVLDKYKLSLSGGRISFDGQKMQFADLILEDKLHLNFALDFKEKIYRATAQADTNRVAFSLDLSRKDHYELKISDLNLSSGAFTVSGSANIAGMIEKDAEGYTESIGGSLKTNKLRFNGTNYGELEIFYKVLSHEFELLSLAFGAGTKMLGNISLKAPYAADLKLILKDYDIKNLALKSETRKKIDLSPINGTVKIDGPLGSLNFQGILESGPGRLKNVFFDSATVKLQGVYPIIKLVDSRIIRADGYLIPGGWVDLSLINESGVFRNVKVKDSRDIILWKGWDITRNKETQNIDFGKNIDERFRINLQLSADDEKESIGPGSLKKDEGIEFHYRLKENDSIKIKMGEDGKEFVGVEHKYRF